MSYDAKQRTKLWLDTYYTAANVLLDDNATPAKVHAGYAGQLIPFERIFYEPNNVDVFLAIGDPESEPLMRYDYTPYGYRENVPIEIYVVDKTGLTAAKVLWKAELELRRIAEAYPLGSVRRFSSSSGNSRVYGALKVWSKRCILGYKRSNDVPPSFPTLGGYVFPNVTDLEITLDAEDDWIKPAGFSGEEAQALGSNAHRITLTADLDVEPDELCWKRPQANPVKTDYVGWQALFEMLHAEGIDESYHALVLGEYGPRFNVRVESATVNYSEGGARLRLVMREVVEESAGTLTYTNRAGLY